MTSLASSSIVYLSGITSIEAIVGINVVVYERASDQIDCDIPFSKDFLASLHPVVDCTLSKPMATRAFAWLQ